MTSFDRPEPQVEGDPELRESLGAGDFCFLAGLILSTFLVAWLEVRGHKGDTIAYYDLSSALHQHQWRACFNASWAPLYPAFLWAGRALFHFNLRYVAAASRLVNFAIALALIASSCFLALSVRRYVVSRHGDLGKLLSHRSLLIWVSSFTFFLWANDLIGEKPDTLLTTLLLLTTASLISGLCSYRWSPFLLAGFAAGCAYWTKSFAFPFVGLLLLFLMVAHWKSPRTLLRLTAAGLVFLCVAGPYIAHISAQKQRFTIGDAGRLNSAWYVNGAERQNPVADPKIDDFASSAGTYRHPAELLSAMPKVAYFPPGRVFGAMPAWDDFSYWSDGLQSRFVPRQTLRIFLLNSRMLLAVIPMRIQLLALFAALWIFGLRLRPRVTVGPALLAIVATALVSVALYLAVHFEGRYIVFTAVICGSIFAAAAHSGRQQLERATLHRVLLLIGFLLLVGEAQYAVRLFKIKSAGDHFASARFDTAEYAVGENLVARFGPHPQIACMGLEACYDDSLWAFYGEATISAAIGIPHLQDSATPSDICAVLMNAGPAPLEALRTRQMRAVVAFFPAGSACSPQWQPIADAPGYYLLPL